MGNDSGSVGERLVLPLRTRGNNFYAVLGSSDSDPAETGNHCRIREWKIQVREQFERMEQFIFRGMQYT